MDRCRIVERPEPPPLPSPTREELIAASLQARVVRGELPPPPAAAEPVTDTGYNFTNYIYRGWEGQTATIYRTPEDKAFAEVEVADESGTAATLTENYLNYDPTVAPDGRRNRTYGRWYVSRTSTGSRDDRRVRPQPIRFDNGPRRTYIAALTGQKTAVVTLSGSIMADNGGMRRITSPVMRFRMLRAPSENPHYTDVRNGSVVVAPSGSGRPEDYPPRVTIGCSAPTAVVKTNEMRRVWRDQANPLWVAAVRSSDWIFHGETGDEMVISELYRQIDWTLDPTEAGHPSGSWSLYPYNYLRPRRSGDFVERVTPPGPNATADELREYRIEVDARLARGLNYEPFTNPTVSPANPRTVRYPDTASGDWDAYRTEIDWLSRQFAQPEYATTTYNGAATSIPAVLRDYLVGTCTVWNRINRDGNVIRNLHNSLPDRPGFELQPPRFVKVILTEFGPVTGGAGQGSGGGGSLSTAVQYNSVTGQMETIKTNVAPVSSL